MRQLTLFSLTLILFVSQGCIVIPLSSKQAMSGVKIDAVQLQFIKVGETTRSQLIQQIGPPEKTYDDILVIAYSWVMPSYLTAWYFPAGQISGTGGGHAIGTPYVLLVEFDSMDRVTRFEVTERGLRDTTRSKAVTWAKAGGNSYAHALPTKFDPIPIPSGKSVIYVYRPGGFEVPYTSVTVSLDGRIIAELRSKEYISIVVEPGLYTIFMHPQSLVSGTGSLDVRAEDRFITVETSTNQASYLEVKVPSGHGHIDAYAKIRQENKALPKLKDLRPW